MHWLELGRVPKMVPGMEPTFLDTLHVIESCLSVNEITELGPKDILDF